MGQLEAVAAKIIMEKRYMILATSKDDIPWAAPLFFGVDSDLNFYFISGKSTRHATHIKQNPNVAVSIFDSHKKPGEADGVYIEGRAGLVEFTAIPRVLLLVYKKRFPNKEERKKHLHPAEDFLGINGTEILQDKTKTYLETGL